MIQRQPEHKGRDSKRPTCLLHCVWEWQIWTATEQAASRCWREIGVVLRRREESRAVEI